MSLAPSRPQNQPFSRPSYQIKRRTVIAAPDPLLTPDDIKTWLGMDPLDVSQDAILTGLIEAATQAVEAYTRRALVSRQYRATYDGWPTGRTNIPIFQGLRQGPTTGTGAATIPLLAPPLISVDRIAWFLMDGTSVDPWPAANYLVDTSDPDQYGRIALANDATPPSPLREVDGLEIDYTAGYGDADAVPYVFKQAVYMAVAFMFQNRGDCNGAGAGAEVDPLKQSGAAGLLQNRRILRL